jgi:hypothetical protein
MLRQRPFRLLLLSTALLFLFPLIAFSSVKSMDKTGEKRPDILTIDIPSSPDHKDMPAVKFKHDLHSQATEGQCIKCHEKKDEITIFKFKRTQDVSGQKFMDLYHDNCIACHEDTKKTNQATGPMKAPSKFPLLFPLLIPLLVHQKRPTAMPATTVTTQRPRRSFTSKGKKAPVSIVIKRLPPTA